MNADQNAVVDKGEPSSSSDRVASGRGKRAWPLILLSVVVLLSVAAGIAYWLATRGFESTDDAYTQGNSVSIAPQVAGFVVQRAVDDNQFVRQGALVLRLDPRSYLAARDQARAALDLARAQLASAKVNLEISQVRVPAQLIEAQSSLTQARANQTNAEKDYERQHKVDPRATTQNNVDQASATLRSDTASVASSRAQVQVAALVPENIETAEDTVKQQAASVKQAEANLAQAEVNLSYTTIRAPQDGYVTMRNFDVGTYLQAGSQAFYLVAPSTWVVANFKETQLARMRPGQHVTITVDAYPHLKLHGHVDSIQQGSGSQFSTFPAQNATGNWVKIVERVPVKILIDDGLDQRRGLPLGISVDPTVDER